MAKADPVGGLMRGPARIERQPKSSVADRSSLVGLGLIDPLLLALALVATWATGEALARRRSRWLLLAGIFCAFSILGKQDSGAAARVLEQLCVTSRG